MRTEGGVARVLPVMAAASLVRAAAAAAAAERPSLSLTGEERWQVKTLQQEMHRRDRLEGDADVQSRLNADRLRILTIPIDAEPGDLPHLQSAAGTPIGTEENIENLEQLWIWSADDGKFKRRAPQYSSQVELQNARILSGAAKVSSKSPYKLEIAASSRLSGRPGEVVNVEFFLENVFGPDRYFFINAQEVQGVSSLNVVNDGVNLAPRQSFLERVSETKTFVRTGARAVIVVTLRIPSTVRNGQVNAFTLEAQPEYADTVDERSLTRRFYFTANGDVEGGDSEPPECSISYPTEASGASEGATAAQLCDGFMGQLCANKMWAANVRFQDRGSGVRRIREAPEIRGGLSENEAFFWHDNFIVGSNLSHDSFYTATCCQRQVAITVRDVRGNTEVCQIGPEAASLASSDTQSRVSDAGLSGLSIAIIVVAALLALVVVGAGVAIALIRNKRKAELAEMRQTPQAR